MKHLLFSREEEKTQRAYDKLAEISERQWSDSEFYREDFTIHFRKLLPAGRVIDLGCGAGRDAHLFLEAGYGYLGVDINRRMIEAARRRAPGAEFREANLYYLPYGAASFDGFWAATSLVHTPRAKLGRAFSQIRKVVKKNGIGFITMREGSGERMVPGPVPGTERFYSFYLLDEFASILRRERFEVLDNFQDLREYHNSNWKGPGPPRVWLQYYVRKM